MIRRAVIAAALCLLAGPALAQSGFGNVPANQIIGGPTSGAAAPPFPRALVPADITAGSPGIDQNVQNLVSANYTVAATDCGKTIVAGTGATGLFTLTLPAPGGFAANCSITIKNGDVTRGKILAGFPGEIPQRLWPLQAVGIKRTGNVWSSFLIPGRWGLAAFGTVNFFVDNVLGNDANDGLGAGAGAFKSFAAAIAIMINDLDTQLQNVTLTLASGQTWNDLVVGGAFTGGGTLIINLNGNTISSSAGGAAINFNAAPNSQTVAFVRNGTITCAGPGGFGFLAIAGAVGIEDGITFGPCPGGTHLWADSPFARIIALYPYTISGGARYHLVAANGGHNDTDSGVVVTVTGNPAFTGAFAYALNGGLLTNTNTFTGTATGFRYQADTGGLVNSGGTGSVFPGSLPGFISGGGIYNFPDAPTISACGTSPVLAAGSTDVQGRVTEGTSATSCVINFASNNQPNACSVTSNNATISAGLVVGVSATALTVLHPSVSGALLYWICMPRGD